MKISQKRRKIGYTYSSVSGSYSFRKTKSIEFESTLERDLLISLAYDSNVDDVIEQPVTIEYVNHNGRDASYTPDFLVHYVAGNDGKITQRSKLIEVKPSAILKKDWGDLKQKFKIGAAYAKDNECVFKIYDESRIHTQRFKNIRFLERYRSLKINEEVLKHDVNQGMLISEVTVGSLASYLDAINGEDANSSALIWHLVYIKYIQCDLSSKLSSETKIWLHDIRDLHG